MAAARDVRSPTGSWHTEPDDDDAEFQLAETTPSQTSTDLDNEDDEDDQDGIGDRIYFDAQEGIFVDGDGDEVDFAMTVEDTVDEEEDDDDDDDDDDDNEDEDEDADAEAEGSRTPQAAAQSQGERQQQPQTISSTSSLPASPPAQPRPGRLRRLSSAMQAQILQLLSHPGIRGILQPGGIITRSAARRGNAQHVELEDDDWTGEEEDISFLGFTGRRRRERKKFVGDRYPPIPSEAGKNLMFEGNFGTNDRCDHSVCGHPLTESMLGKRKRLSRRMLDREMGVENRGRHRALNSLATQSLIPSGSKADLIVNMDARCYSGQFSEDGSFFFACGQDYRVQMYDTSNPYDWKYYKTVRFDGGQWTITDASLSPDNKYLAYSSIRSQICLASTDRNDDSDPAMLDFSDMGHGGHGVGGGRGWGRNRGHFGIWSLRFSGDGREIVAGTSDESVYVYDLESRRSILRIPGHTDDVNAVCFGDKMSPHILYSGSDDTTLKVWDRRSLASMRPAGMFLGHTEGLTYIDSRGDGRYVISNAKDQTCKLWDLRKMISTDEGERINPQKYTTNFDYRFSPYDTSEHEPHPHDCSLVTFRGHRVLKTLIRCHFSPAGSTDGRYVYSGSHDGKIYIWNLDGTQASEPINVLAATKNSRPLSDEMYVDHSDYYGQGGVWKTIVRDCSWHPSAPIIAATSWNGWDHGLGTCTVHTWDDGADADEVGGGSDGFTGAEAGEFRKAASLGSTPLGARVTAHLRHEDRFYGTGVNETRNRRRSRAARQTGRLAALWGGDDSDDADTPSV